MPRGLRTVAAFILAPALIAAGAGLLMQPDRPLQIAIPAAFVTHAHTVSLGVPIFLWLHRKAWFGVTAVLVSSSLIGTLPVAIWLFSGPFANYARVDSAVLIENGVLTTAGIISNIGFSLMAGAFGLATGIAWLLIAGKPTNGLPK